MEKITLKAARINNRYTITEAAKKLGISVVTLSKYENGVRFPNVKTINKILELYKLDYSNVDFLCNQITL